MSDCRNIISIFFYTLIATDRPKRLEEIRLFRITEFGVLYSVTTNEVM